MFELKVRKFGNSLGVALPEEVVERLQAGPGKSVFLIEKPDGTYQLTRSPEFDARMAKARDIMGRYRSALNKLAK
jgi:putative addiction module antidote